MKPNHEDGTMGIGVPDASLDFESDFESDFEVAEKNGRVDFARVGKLERRIDQLEAALKRVATPVTTECRTNLDKFKGVMWPKTAAYPPQKGECIEGRSWDGREVVARLHVVQVTHCVDRQDKPYLRIELHL